MSAISLKSITGITSITTPAGLDNQLTLHTNNTVERLRIDSSGNIGINSTAPNTALDVIAGSSGRTWTPGTSVVSMFERNGHTRVTLTSGASSYGEIDFGDTNDDNAGYIRYDHSDNSMSIRTNTDERLRINSDGKIGIATNTGSGLINTRHAGTNQQVFQFRADLGSSNGRSLNLYTPDTDNSTAPFRFQTGNGYLFQCDGANVFTIAHDRRVGINSTAPTNTLVVREETDNNPSIQLFRPSTGGDIANIIWATNQGNQASINYRGAAPAGMQFYTGGTGSSNLRAIITLTGKVGIGTDSPAEKLSVEDSSPAILINATSATGESKLQFGRLGNTNVGEIKYEHSNNAFTFRTNDGADRLRIDSSGRVLIGTATVKSSGSGQYAKLNVEGYIGGSECFASFSRAEAASAMSKDDEVANLTFNDSAGYEFARIQVLADNDTGATDTPGRIVFRTTADGASSSTERLRIDSSGKITHTAATDTVATLDLYGGNTTVSAVDEVNAQLRFRSKDISVTNAEENVGGTIRSITEYSNGAYVGLSFETYKQDRTPRLQEAVRIRHDGKVGIGTNNPVTTLDVRGDVAVDYNATHALRFYTQPRNNWSSISNTATDSNANLSFKSAQGEAMHITYSKLVGIGTDDPTALLHVAKYTYDQPDHENFFRIKLQDQGGVMNDVGIGQVASGSLSFNNTASGRFTFHNGTNGEVFRIESGNSSGGGVGISTAGGTITPAGNSLLIRGGSTVGTNKGHIMLTGDSATVNQGPQIVFSESGSGSSYAGGSIGFERKGDNSQGDLIFGTRGTSGDADTTTTERLRIDSSGRLLVGLTSDPAESSIVAEGNSNSGTSYAVLDLRRGQAATSSGNVCGYIRFSDTNIDSSSRNYAWIAGMADGTSSSGADNPGRLVFATCPDNSTALQERLRITSEGQLRAQATYNGNSSTSNNFPVLNINNLQGSYTAGNILGGVTFGKAPGHSSGIRAGMLALYSNTGSDSSNVGTHLVFRTASESAGDSAEKLRIESGGTVRTANGVQSGGNSTGGFKFTSQYSGKGYDIAAQYATQANGGSDGNDPVFSGWWGANNTFRVNTDGKVRYGVGLGHAVQSKGFILYPDNGSNNTTTIRVSGLVSGCFIFQMGYYNSQGQGEGGFACAVSGYMTSTNQYTIDNIKAPYAHANSSISSIDKQNSYFEFSITNNHASFTGGGTCGIIGDQEMVITVTYS